jgi:hypothetical protein
MFSKIKVKNMSDMLKLDFGSDDIQSVDLSSGNNGFSRIRTVDDTHTNNSPDFFKPRSTPNLDMISNKESDLGLQLLMNRDVSRKSPSSSNSPNRGMSPSSLNLGSNSPSQSSYNDNKPSMFGRSFDFSEDDNNSSRSEPRHIDFTPNKLESENDLSFEENNDALKPNFNILGDKDNDTDNSNSNSSGGFFSGFGSKPRSTTFDSDPNPDHEPKRMTFEEQQKKKADMLRKLNRLSKKGYFVYRNFDMNSEFEDIKNEYENVKEEASLQRSLRQQKDILITASRVIEGAAGTELVQEYTGKLELEGWSQHMMETVDDYEDIMEDLHSHYGKMLNDGEYPIARLLFAVIHSAVMFHITKKYVQQMPNLGNLLNQNPGLAREFSRATANFVGQQNPAFAGMMNDMETSQNMNNMEPRDMQGPRDLENILNRLNGGGGMNEPMQGGININL